MRQMIKKAAVVLSVVMVCAPLGAMAANKLIVKGTDGTTDKMVVTDTGYIGVGTSTPIKAINTKSGYGSASSILLEFSGNASYNRYSDAEMMFARNNINDPTQNNGLAFQGDRLGYFTFGTMKNSSFYQSAGLFSEAAENHTAGSHAGNLYLATTSPNAQYAGVRMAITSSGNVGIGTIDPKSKLHVIGIPEFVDNTSALTGGLTVGAIYRTGDILKIVH